MGSLMQYKVAGNEILDYLSCELSSDKARTLIIGFSNIVSLDICMFSKDLDEGGEL